MFAIEPAKPVKNVPSSYNNFTVFTEEKLSLIEDNLLSGVKSKNSGLQTSCAYYLGEMNSSKAMIPLLILATTGDTEEARIIAGLSLYKIHSKIGMYRLKGLSKSDESELVRRVFDRIYKKYVSDNYSFDEM
jgi:HEAT repeat protein